MNKILIAVIFLSSYLSAFQIMQYDAKSCDTEVKNREFILGGKKILPATTTMVNLELPKFYNTPTQIPVRVIRGKLDGPIVFISATIHGDELNGIEIIRRFRKLKILEELKGIVILIPIVNVYGVMNLSRYLPDRRDLNRAFPGTSKGSLASRTARIFFDEVVMKSDLGIDIHTASLHRTNFPQIRTNIDNKYTFRLAKAFEAPVVLHSEERDGSLRQVAQDYGIPILLYEAGEALRFDETSIRIGVKGIVNVLRENGMLPRNALQKSTKTPIVVRESKWVRATESGIIRTIKGLGETVRKNEAIAYITEPLSDESFKISAPYDGIIIGKSEIPLVQEGDAIFHIADFKNIKVANKKISYFSEDAIEKSENVEPQNEEALE